MKERPILFSGPMVRAIRENRKTQTRRVVKLPAGEWQHDAKLQELDNKSRPLGHPRFGFESRDGRFFDLLCPYGGVGEELWVRETFLPKASGTLYRADFDPVEAAGLGGMYGGWKPSIFMPRNRSRITMGITEVRVERLQEINKNDALAEGTPDTRERNEDMRDCYRKLWDSINSEKHPWSSNPWVWVIQFKQLAGAA